MTRFLRAANLFVLMILASNLYSQNWVEERTYISGGITTARIDGLLTSPLNKTWGDFVWFQVQQSYSQAYAGLTYNPKLWVQFALGGGLEQDKNPARIGSYTWVGNKHSSILFTAEDGGSGFWHKTEALHTFNRFFDGGFIEERYKGSGAELKLKIPHTPLAIWASPMLSRDSTTHHLRINALLGVRWTL